WFCCNSGRTRGNSEKTGLIGYRERGGSVSVLGASRAQVGVPLPWSFPFVGANLSTLGLWTTLPELCSSERTKHSGCSLAYCFRRCAPPCHIVRNWTMRKTKKQRLIKNEQSTRT